MPEIVLKPDGSAFYRAQALTVDGERPISIDAAILENMPPLKMPMPFMRLIDGLPMSVMQTAQRAVVVSVRLDCLTLETTFATDGGIVYPTFRRTAETGDKIAFSWPAPDDMRLMLAFEASFNMGTWGTGMVWLVAFAEARSLLLPIPNLYDDAHLCTDGWDGAVGTLQDVTLATVSWLRSSTWNADLLGEGRRQHARELFRFKADETGKLIPIPPGRPWADYCQTVGTPAIENIIL